MAAATVDPVYLSTYLNLPQSTIISVLDTPTLDLVNSILEAVTIKAREHEELQADKLRVDIELENAVRSAESRSQGLKATVDKALKDVEELRQQLKSEGILRFRFPGGTYIWLMRSPPHRKYTLYIGD